MKKIAKVIIGYNISSVINSANEQGVAKDDIVTILPMREGYAMIYYGE